MMSEEVLEALKFQDLASRALPLNYFVTSW